MSTHTKTDEFSEKFQTAFDPPRFFPEFMTEVRKGLCCNYWYIIWYASMAIGSDWYLKQGLVVVG